MLVPPSTIRATTGYLLICQMRKRAFTMIAAAAVDAIIVIDLMTFLTERL